MELRGRAALVTGGGVGTGRAIALALAAEGCDIAVNYSRSQVEAEEAAAAARELGVRAFAVRADVADDGAVRSMVAEAVRTFGRLDVVVNNAGTTAFIPHGDLEGVTDEVWDRIFAVNLKGAFYTVRAAAAQLRARRGAVVNVSSVAGVYGMGSSIPYCASKAALNILTVALARALAPEVRVNAVAPGFIDTRWWKQFAGYEGIKQMALERTLIRRVCMPEDVAAVALSLVRADCITGQVVVVDGGMGLGR